MTTATQSDFNDLLELATPALRPIMLGLRDMVFEIDPKVCEVVRLGDRAATYGVGPKKMSQGYCYIMPHKNWINLGFFQGAHLSDSAALLEGGGRNMRHVKIHILDEVGRIEVATLVRAARVERLAANKA